MALHVFLPLDITLFRPITMFSGIDIIMWIFPMFSHNMRNISLNNMSPTKYCYRDVVVNTLCFTLTKSESKLPNILTVNCTRNVRYNSVISTYLKSYEAHVLWLNLTPCC